ncbi:MAG TPA: LacI family DNA-binding transcriptional regulator [Streptosporangiaceae bacterium]
MTRRPTSRDVAVAAGVSQSTVSIVLAGKWAGRVSAPTAQAVHEAAERLGYRPNLAARNLRLGQTRTVLFVVPTLTSPFFGAVYTGAARVAAAHGFGVVVYPWPAGTARERSPFAAPRGAVPAPSHPAGAVEGPSWVASWKEIDGVLASSMAADALAELLARDDGSPALVMLDSDPADPVPTVNVDVAESMRTLVAHLAGLGHRRFGHLAADIDVWTFRTRGEALAAAVAELPGATLVRQAAPIAVDGARTAAHVLLRDAPTALLCDADVLAAGAYKAARDAGLDVPGDLSIGGIDDILLAEALEPELTTVRLPAEALGERAMAALLELLDGGRPQTVSLPGDLVVRASTAPPPDR